MQESLANQKERCGLMRRGMSGFPEEMRNGRCTISPFFPISSRRYKERYLSDAYLELPFQTLRCRILECTAIVGTVPSSAGSTATTQYNERQDALRFVITTVLLSISHVAVFRALYRTPQILPGSAPSKLQRWSPLTPSRCSADADPTQLDYLVRPVSSCVLLER